MVTIVSACNNVNLNVLYAWTTFKVSMERGSVEHEPVSESSENAVEDDLNNVEEVTEFIRTCILEL